MQTIILFFSKYIELVDSHSHTERERYTFNVSIGSAHFKSTSLL